jgi:cation diffusion facilitator CzcD-associated flavoprotein CzcO
MPAPSTLPDLEADLRRDLELLDFPARPWSPARTTQGGRPVLDCLIVGGGQGGLAVAFGLLREKISNLLVVDENPEDRAGPWRNFARMRTLRTPKHLTGPDLGVASLTFRAWYEAQHGADAWARLGLIPKEQWADYLHWYRRVLAIPTRHETRAGALEWNGAERCFDVPVTRAGATETLHARTVVLATGIDGSGYWATPEIVAGLPRRLWAHTHDPIDFAALRGKRLGVLGAGASAFDNASVALEAGAAEVHLFHRRERLPNVNPYRWAEFAGFLRHLGDLDDASRYRFIHKILEIGQLPPADTYARARGAGHFELHPGCTWERAEAAGEGVRVHTARGDFDFDFLIFGTGFVTDLSRRPELAKIHDHIALWRDCYTPPTKLAHAELARHPYLGPSFEHRDKTGGDAPWLANLFNYTFGCLLSLGFGGASISGMKYSVPKVVYGVTRRLFVEDGPAHFDTLATYRTEEFEVAP